LGVVYTKIEAEHSECYFIAISLLFPMCYCYSVYKAVISNELLLF